MAKSKGGLGRGLNSLIGGYEAPSEPPSAPVQQSDRHENRSDIQASDAQSRKEQIEQKGMPAPRVEREVIREEDLPQEDRVVLNNEKKDYSKTDSTRNGSSKLDIPAARTPVRDVVAKKELIEENDGVTIKGVVERAARSNNEETSQEENNQVEITDGVSLAQAGPHTASEKTLESAHSAMPSTPVRYGAPQSPQPPSLQTPSFQRNAFMTGADFDKTAGSKVGVVNSQASEIARIAPAEEVKAPATDEVPLDMIHPNPDQPRMHFNQEELEELSSSIEKDGLLQPILVREDANGYEIIAGERRWQACKLAGLKKVPVRIKEADDIKVLELALIENLQRSDLNPIEEAYGYKRMMERGGRTQSEVALAVSKGRSTIANALRLLDLPEEAQQLLYEEVITAGHARAILSIPTEEGRQKLTEKLKNDKISVREAEAIARLITGRQNAGDKPKKPPMPQVFKITARSLGQTLGTKVRIKTTNGKNKIEIEFKDEDELQRLFDLMNGSE